MRILCVVDVVNLIVEKMFKFFYNLSWYSLLRSLLRSVDKKNIIKFFVIIQFNDIRFSRRRICEIWFISSIFDIKIKCSEFFNLTHLTCVKFFRDYKITKICIIWDHVYKMFIILQIISSIFKIKHDNIQLFIVRVLTFFRFFKLIIKIRNKMSLFIRMFLS